MTQQVQAMTRQVQGSPVTVADESEPAMVLFSDETDLDLADEVELITLTSASLGAIIARRC
jgi:hypothetical protein